MPGGTSVLFYPAHREEQKLISHQNEPRDILTGVQLAVGRYSPSEPSRPCIRRNIVQPNAQPLNCGGVVTRTSRAGEGLRPEGGACFPNPQKKKKDRESEGEKERARERERE